MIECKLKIGNIRGAELVADWGGRGGAVAATLFSLRSRSDISIRVAAERARPTPTRACSERGPFKRGA